MLIPVPDGISNEAAVLADPFSVSFHAIVRHPPPPRGGCSSTAPGALGLTSVAILRCPLSRTSRSAWWPASRPSARWRCAFGASARVRARAPARRSSRRWPSGPAASCTLPLDGLPVTHPGHIDVVYDSIAKAETLEVGVRVLAERGRLVYTGVATPERWESTPIYFKEITIAGSNAFGMEDFEGRRQHAIAHYLQLVDDGRLDITPMLTHRFAPRRVVARAQGPGPQDQSGALKVAFTPNASAVRLRPPPFRHRCPGR